MGDPFAAAKAEIHARYRLTRWLCRLGLHSFQWWHMVGQNCVRCGKDKEPGR